MAKGKGKKPSRKGVPLGHRDINRTRFAVDLINGPNKKFSSTELQERYFTDVKDSSFHKTFTRDTPKLEESGVYLTKSRQGTAREYSLDRERSLATRTTETDEILFELATLMRPLVSDPSTADAKELGFAIPRIALSTCSGPAASALPELEDNPEARNVLDKVNEARRQHRPLKLMYQPAGAGEPSERVVCPYGIFTYNGAIYLVGLRRKEGSESKIRTYRLSRASSPEVLKDADVYQIPSGFSAQDRIFKPFEVGEDNKDGRRHAVVYARRGEADRLKNEAPKAGKLTTIQGGAARWTDTDGTVVRNFKALASWCVGHGFIPLEPQEVVGEWHSLLTNAESNLFDDALNEEA